jgi:putative membrane protein
MKSSTTTPSALSATIKTLITKGALICVFGATSSLAFALDKIDAEDFVEEASAKGIAEVESAKLALEKSTSADIQAFAKRMISDHTAANRELAGIAARKKLEVEDEAELMNKAKKFILEMRDGESFDEAYANNQVNAHETTIELFKRAAMSDDADIATFAKQTLPKLEQHMTLAKALATAYDDDRNDMSTTNNSIQSRTNTSTVKGTTHGAAGDMNHSAHANTSKNNNTSKSTNMNSTNSSAANIDGRSRN